MNDMSVFFNETLDDKFLTRLESCMNSLNDTDLLGAQNSGWRKMAQYYDTNGTNSDYMNEPDEWGSCTVLNHN